MSKQETIDGILALGYTEIEGSKKYRVFQKPNSQQRLLVGNRGALRLTKTTISKSVSKTGTREHRAYAYVGSLVGKFNPMTIEIAQRAWTDHLYGLVK